MSTVLVWLRNDLRVADNPALDAALRSGERVVALFVHETDKAIRAPGGAARWWLHQSLTALGKDLAGSGVALQVETGPATEVVDRVRRELEAGSVHWNRRYGPGQREVDAAIQSELRKKGVNVVSYAGNVLIEPWDIETGQGRPYSVFTPFWKALKQRNIVRPLPRSPMEKTKVSTDEIDSDYTQPKWAGKLAQHWNVGESAAQQRLAQFLEHCVEDYPKGRDYPARSVTSQLSAHLRSGEISVRQIWHAARTFAHAHPDSASAVEKFLSELAWRDFSYHQLYHRDDIANSPMQAKYADLKWRHAPMQLKAWQTGQTGIPLIDAGMRELWETGYMHNRVRMLAASFLTKNLLIDWREGEHWFWDCLVDADDANNPASWQWVAGSGLDAAPYFRIFNPVTQGERFDPEGDYVRRWVPEVSALPDKFIHDPSRAPENVLEQAGITLDDSYPRAIVDLKDSRRRALDAFEALSADA